MKRLGGLFRKKEKGSLRLNPTNQTSSSISSSSTPSSDAPAVRPNDGNGTAIIPERPEALQAPHSSLEENSALNEGLQEQLFPNGHMYGVRVLYDPENPVVDIVFVHGLNGNPYKTWMEPEKGVYWPVHLLPKDVHNARIMTFGYDADWKNAKGLESFFQPVGTCSLTDHAVALVSDLAGKRVEASASARKIIFIAHSLGGLVTKKAFSLSAAKPDKDPLRQLYEHTIAIAFLGTPHRGSGLAPFASVVANVIKTLRLPSNPKILEVLNHNSKLLSETQAGFASLVLQAKDRLDVICFWEELPLPGGVMVVPKESATIEEWNQLPIRANHRNMTKFNVSEDQGYIRICDRIQHWLSSLRKGAIETLPSIDIPPNSIARPNRKFTSGEKACLSSLSFPEMGNRKLEIEHASSGTCKWLLLHHKYQRWLSEGRGMFWIKGKPGSGKSTLMRFALDNLVKNNQDPSGPYNLSFFFHGRGTELERKPDGLYRSLLHQLLTAFPSQFEPLVQYFQTKHDADSSGFTWSLRVLKSFLKSGLAEVLEVIPIRMFVDALDESGREVARTLVDDFSELIHLDSNESLSICFSCRHYPIIAPDRCVSVCAEDENYGDVKGYIQKGLRRFLGENPDGLGDLDVELENQSRGVFQWVVIQLPRLREGHQEGKSVEELKIIVRRTPQELHEVYQGIFMNLTQRKDNGARSMQLFRWIYFSQRPLAITELRWAMNIAPNSDHHSFAQIQELPHFLDDKDGDQRMKKQLNALSGGLAEIKGEEGKERVQFIHQSVNDYLLCPEADDGTQLQGGFFILDSPTGFSLSKSKSIIICEAQVMLYQSCVVYFTMEEITTTTTENLETKFPLLEYALTFWLEHAECAAATEMLQGELLETPNFWRSSADTVARWSRLLELTDNASWPDFAPGTTVLHVAAAWNLVSIVTHLLTSSITDSGHSCTNEIGEVNTVDSFGRTALMLAAMSGYEAIVEQLLAYPDIEVNTLTDGWTPLMWVVRYRYEAVVKQLLAHPNIEVNTVEGTNGQTALILAARRSFDAVVKQLVAHPNIEVNTVDRDGETALMIAASRGHEKTAQHLLLHPKTDINAMDSSGRTLLTWAGRKGLQPAVKLLLAHPNIEVNAKGSDGWTVLMWAAYLGHEAIVNQLLAHPNIEVNTLSNGRNPLLLAAEEGHETVVKHLLSHSNIDVNVTDNNGWTALMWAAHIGHEAVIKHLLAQPDTEVNTLTDGWTPLLLAAEGGHETVIKQLLIHTNIDVNVTDNDGRTALMRAARDNHPEIVKLLEQYIQTSTPPAPT